MVSLVTEYHEFRVIACKRAQAKSRVTRFLRLLPRQQLRCGSMRALVLRFQPSILRFANSQKRLSQRASQQQLFFVRIIFGVAGWHVERLAQQGTIGWIVGNSPAAISPFGGSKPIFGTNPIAFAAPRLVAQPLVIDLSLSKVARGKVMVAAQEGNVIPEDWGLDKYGQPTTDPNAVLDGSMLPMGGAKGAALVLMVEILSAALSGANFGFEATSFFEAEGEPPAVGQTIVCIDPDVFSGGHFTERLEVLLDELLDQEGTRLPGSKRLNLREQAATHGIAVSRVSLDEINQLVNGEARS